MRIIELNNKTINLLDNAKHIVPVIIRIIIAKIFFFSGLTKIANWEQTLFLFEYEYAVPLLPINIAASLATSMELALPIFIIAGLFTRFATLPLLGMTLVIQFFVYNQFEHYYWMALLLTLIAYGGGKLSLDHILAKKFRFKV